MGFQGVKKIHYNIGGDIVKSSLLSNFVEEIQFKNRNPKETEVLKLLNDMSTNPEKVIFQGNNLYRSRIILRDRDINKQEGFFGFNAEDSFVPPWNITRDLRANYKYIPYLYCSNDPYLSIIEVRPRMNAKVSVATIFVNEKIKLLDFTVEHRPKKMSEPKYDLFCDLSELYSKPVTTDDDVLDYIPTQFIAEYVKGLGYDGIAFTSSLSPEIIGLGLERFNVVIFNYNKCTPISSNVFRITRKYFECEQIDDDAHKLSIINRLEEELKQI